MHTQVRFSDEKRFLVWNDGPVMVWRKKNQRLVQGYVRGTTKNRKGVMVWMCIASDGRSRLYRCTDRQDSASYQENILTPALNFIRRRGPPARNNIVFQQDGASCHTSRSTMAFLAARRVKVLAPWPPYSPDLNPVEHCWAYIARQLIGQCFPTADAIFAAVEKAWADRPEGLIPSLYGSMVRRMTAVSVARGGATRY